jgi:hypothetical protein
MNKTELVAAMAKETNLSKKDVEAVLKSFTDVVADELKKGGKMIFSCFIMTEENKDHWCWGIKDENGRGYCHFFSQLTEADTEEELINFLKKIGYNILKFEVHHHNHLDAVIQKQ